MRLARSEGGDRRSPEPGKGRASASRGTAPARGSAAGDRAWRNAGPGTARSGRAARVGPAAMKRGCGVGGQVAACQRDTSRRAGEESRRARTRNSSCAAPAIGARRAAPARRRRSDLSVSRRGRLTRARAARGWPLVEEAVEGGQIAAAPEGPAGPASGRREIRRRSPSHRCPRRSRSRVLVIDPRSSSRRGGDCNHVEGDPAGGRGRRVDWPAAPLGRRWCASGSPQTGSVRPSAPRSTAVVMASARLRPLRSLRGLSKRCRSGDVERPVAAPSSAPDADHLQDLARDHDHLQSAREDAAREALPIRKGEDGPILERKCARLVRQGGWAPSQPSSVPPSSGRSAAMRALPPI